MNSRQLIKHVIAFDAAPRIGYHLPEPWPCDVVHAGVDDDPAFEPRRWTEGDTEFWTDEWGCTWQRLGGISKGEVAEGALADWADLAPTGRPITASTHATTGPARFSPAPMASTASATSRAARSTSAARSAASTGS